MLAATRGSVSLLTSDFWRNRRFPWLAVASAKAAAFQITDNQ